MIFTWATDVYKRQCLDVLRKKNKKVQACVYVTGDPEADASCIPVHAKKDVNVWQVPSDVVLRCV